MPELPEVETVVRTLQPLVGMRLGTAHALRTDIIHGQNRALASFVKGRRVRGISRQAKRIIFDLGNERRMQFHLGMTGQLNVKERGAPLLPHTHLRFGLIGTGRELRFRDVRRFGGVWLLAGAAGPGGRGLGLLGPDALTVPLRDFRELLTRQRQIKALLLDQTALGGLGNIYADEALFRSRIHPLTKAGELSAGEVAALHRAMRRILQGAIKAGGSTISDYRTPNGERGWFQFRHQAYGREGRPCRRCRTPILRIQAAGRSSHICPLCQQVK